MPERGAARRSNTLKRLGFLGQDGVVPAPEPRDGAAALHGGPLGEAVVACIAGRGGALAREDLTGYRTRERAALACTPRSRATARRATRTI